MLTWNLSLSFAANFRTKSGDLDESKNSRKSVICVKASVNCWNNQHNYADRIIYRSKKNVLQDQGSVWLIALTFKLHSDLDLDQTVNHALSLPSSV